MKYISHGHSASRMEASEAGVLIDRFLSDDRRKRGSSACLTGKKGGDR